MTNQINLNNKILTFRYELSKFSTNFIIGFYSVLDFFTSRPFSSAIIVTNKHDGILTQAEKITEHINNIDKINTID